MYKRERERERVVQVGRMSRLSCKLVYFMKVFHPCISTNCNCNAHQIVSFCVTAHHSPLASLLQQVMIGVGQILELEIDQCCSILDLKRNIWCASLSFLNIILYETSSPLLRPILWISKTFGSNHFHNKLEPILLILDMVSCPLHIIKQTFLYFFFFWGLVLVCSTSVHNSRQR